MKTLLGLGMLVMGVVTFSLMGYDKRCAVMGKWRVRERTLFLCAALLGGIGGVLGMMVFRHKTKHLSFRMLFPAFAAIQVVLLVILEVGL